MKIFIKYILVCALLSSALTLKSQVFTITLIDAKTKSPVPYAHAIVTQLASGKESSHITGMKGSFGITLAGPARIVATCVGYLMLEDTLAPGKDFTLELKPAIFEIDEVVVTAQYKPERADNSIYDVQVINSMKIRQKAAANLTELLSDELGIRTSQDGALGSSLSIRGLSGEHVKFLIDGVPVIGRMNGNIDPTQINLNNVDHIEIIEGPMSVVYGSNALAGVINIITKEKSFNSVHTHLDGYYESVGTYNFSAGASMKQGRHAGSLDIARNFFSGYAEDEDSRNLTWKPKRQIDVDGYYMLNLRKSSLKFSGQYFDEVIQNKGELLPPYYEYAFDSYFYTKRGTAKAEFRSDVGRDHYLDLFVAYSAYNRIKETYLIDLTTLEELLTQNDEDQDTSAFDSYMSRGTFSRKANNQRLEYQMGYELQYETGEGKRITDQKQQIGDYAAFLSIKYMLTPLLALQPGIRYGYNSKYTFPVVYSLNLKWDLTEYTNLRASYSRGFRAPSLKELYLYFVDINHNVQGNPNLQAEYSHSINAGYYLNNESGRRAWGIEMIGFYNYIDNIITLAQLEGDLYTYVNLDNYTTAGGQLNTFYRLYPFLSLKAGLARTGRTSGIEGADNTLKFSTDVNSTVLWKLVKANLEFSLFYKYTGRLPLYYMNDQGELEEGYVEDYNTMDFSASKSLMRNTLNLSAGVKNIFDNTNLDIAGGASGTHGSSGSSMLAGYGRTFFVKATWTFDKYIRNEK